MAVKEILLLGNPILREQSKILTEFDQDLDNLIHDLKETLVDFQKRKEIGRGIAAPQIGTLKKAIYLHLPNRSFALVNPQIIWNSNETITMIFQSCCNMKLIIYMEF